MEEIKFENDKLNNTKTEYKKGRIVTIGLVILLVTFAFIAVTLSGCSSLVDDSSDAKVKSKLDISNTKMSVEYSEYLGYSAEITGIAKNVTKRDFSYASIEFSIYDINGNNLGTALANINNLAAGDTWNFEANLFSFSNTKPSTYKLVEITTW